MKYLICYIENITKHVSQKLLKAVTMAVLYLYWLPVFCLPALYWQKNPHPSPGIIRKPATTS